MIKLSPAVAGFAKGLGIAVLLAVVSYFGDAAHLGGVVSPTLAVLIASIASAVESSLKASSGGTSALFGAVRIK